MKEQSLCVRVNELAGERTQHDCILPDNGRPGSSRGPRVDADGREDDLMSDVPCGTAPILPPSKPRMPGAKTADQASTDTGLANVHLQSMG